MARHTLVSLDLLIADFSRLHSDTLPSVGLLRTSDRPAAETSTWQQRQASMPMWNSNPQS